ncbi:MAG: hypothetical protein SFU86_12040 [Pirellulaceae bacterium]|nr:hypothetical protein [Pirellulaceae bacterium]
MPSTSQIATLRERVARLEQAAAPTDERPISTGLAELDAALPAGGLRRGTLIEYLAAEGAAAATLALAAGRAACGEDRALVVVDRRQIFYPLAAHGWGIDLARTIVLRPATAADELWALDQALRSPAVGAVWARVDKLAPRDFRRLQLAAEQGGGVGLLLRPASARDRPTWSDLQWLVEPRPSWRGWRLAVELVRCRGGTAGRRWLLELSESTGDWRAIHDGSQTNPGPATAELAHPAALRRSARA